MRIRLIVVLICFNAIAVFAQTQKFDIMTFTPPKGWEAKVADNSKMYSKVDTAKNTFGIIIVHPSIDSKGNAADDFKFVWKQLVQNEFGASAKPETETSQDKGFTIVSGGELIKYEGIQALAMLTVISGKGKVVSILTITNEQSYANATQSLLESMNINVPASPTTANDTNSITYSGNGSVGDYSFTTPKGWTRQNNSGEIVLKKEQRYTISFLPMMQSSGNLESDANRIMFQVFKGWVPWTQGGFKADAADLEKGKTMQGFEYFMLRKMLNQANNDSIQTDAIVLLVKVGSNVALIVGSEPFQSLGGETSKAIDNILFDLNIGSSATAYNLKNELLGSWTMVGSGVGSSTTYNPNGTFLWGGASQSRVSNDAYTDKVTTTSYANNGSYSLSGNVLTTTFKSTGRTNKERIRFYQTRSIGSSEMFGNRIGEWQPKMGKLSIDGSVSGSVYYTRDK